MTESFTEHQLMKIALEEQNKCTSYPKVGAVIAKDGKILAQAYREEIPKKHAERIAIEKLAPKESIGTTLITTLEPCVEISCQQSENPCTDLIIERKINNVIIGVLDPNGKIYCQGYEKLLSQNIKVDFFPTSLREQAEANTFKHGDCSIGYGSSGKRRVAVIGSGKNFEIQFSKSDSSSIKFRWQTLQYSYGVVDLTGENDSIRCALGASSFSQITEPLVFREPSHFSRMKKGDIAVLAPSSSKFVALVQLLDISETDIWFQWQVRNK